DRLAVYKEPEPQGRRRESPDVAPTDPGRIVDPYPYRIRTGRGVYLDGTGPSVRIHVPYRPDAAACRFDQALHAPCLHRYHDAARLVEKLVDQPDPVH